MKTELSRQNENFTKTAEPYKASFVTARIERNNSFETSLPKVKYLVSKYPSALL